MKVLTQTTIIAYFYDALEDGAKRRKTYYITHWKDLYVLHSAFKDNEPEKPIEYSEGISMVVAAAKKRGLYEVNSKGEPVL